MKKIILITLIITFSFITSIKSSVAEGITPSQPNSTSGATTVQLPNPLTGSASSDSIPVFLGKIINAAMGILGSLALVMFIYGGITWMLSAGNPEKVKTGQQIIIWSTLGIAIIFTSYALVRFVISAISGAT